MLHFIVILFLIPALAQIPAVLDMHGAIHSNHTITPSDLTPSNNTLPPPKMELRQQLTLLPLDGRNIATIICVFLGSIFTTMSGVGGGGIYIPVFMLLLNLDVWYAVPLSTIAIAGGSLIKVLFFIAKRHPLSNKRFLIDYTPIQIIVPFDGNTAFLGLLLSMVAPDIINLICIIIVIGITFYKTFRKAIAMYNKEKRIRLSPDRNLHCLDGIEIYMDDIEMQEILEEDMLGDTWGSISKYLTLLAISFAIVTAFTYTRKLLDICDYKYWVHFGAQVVVLGTWGIFILWFIIQDYQKKTKNKFRFIDGDIRWKLDHAAKYAGIATVTGAVSTYLGIGGGMLISPIMVGMGMRPEVMIATGAVTTLFSSFISASQYIIADRLLWDFAVVMIVAAMAGSFIGIKLNSYLIKKFQRQSVIVMLLALILFTSLILLITNGVTRLQKATFDFTLPCR